AGEVPRTDPHDQLSGAVLQEVFEPRFLRGTEHALAGVIRVTVRARCATLIGNNEPNAANVERVVDAGRLLKRVVRDSAAIRCGRGRLAGTRAVAVVRPVVVIIPDIYRGYLTVQLRLRFASQHPIIRSVKQRRTVR